MDNEFVYVFVEKYDSYFKGDYFKNKFISDKKLKDLLDKQILLKINLELYNEFIGNDENFFISDILRNNQDILLDEYIELIKNITSYNYDKKKVLEFVNKYDFFFNLYDFDDIQYICLHDYTLKIINDFEIKVYSDIFNKKIKGEIDISYISQNNIKEEFRDLVKTKNLIIEENFLDKLKQPLCATKGTLNTILKEVKSEKNQNKKTKYSLIYNQDGIFFIKSYFSEIYNKIIDFEIASFKELTNMTRTDIDNYTGKKDVVKNIIYSVPLLRDDLSIEVENRKDVCSMLEKCKHSSSYTISIEDYENFSKVFSKQKNLKKIHKKQVNVYCYRDGKYYEPSKYECYNVITTKLQNQLIPKKINGNVCNNFLDFLELKCDKDILEQCIIYLNKLPVNDEDSKLWKIILSKSISMMLKMELVRLGVNFFPLDVIMGDRGTGKSTLNDLLVCKIWNSKERHNTELEGSIGARIDYPNDIRPICYQEVTKFNNKWINMMKEGATKGEYTIVKGKRDGGQYLKVFYQNILIDSNEFSVNDDAFEQRICFWEKNIKLDGKDNFEELNYLKNNIIHLGKYLYDNFKNLNTEDLWEESKQFVNKLDLTKDIRTKIKYQQIRFGELIIKKIIPELYKNIEIDYKNIFSKSTHFLFNKEDDIKDLFVNILSKISIFINPNEYTLTKIINIKDEYTIDLIQPLLLDKYGIVIGRSNNIIITKYFLSNFNEKIKLFKKFKSLKELDKILGENKVYKYRLYGKNKCVRGIDITKLIGLEDESESEIVEENSNDNLNNITLDYDVSIESMADM